LNPQVRPLDAIESLVAHFAAWARRVGEDKVAYAALALGFALAAGLILVWGQGQSFIQDEWNYLVVRTDWAPETLLRPQNGHLIAVPLLVYKGLFATVGAESHLPFQATTVVFHLTIATLFFLLVRPRLPLAVAVALTLLLAFFGTGWDTLMSAYEIPNLTGMAAGLGMLLALGRRTRGGDLAACLLLGISLASFSVGIAFALGALLSVWLEGRAQWRRIWIVLVPAVLYAAWFLWARQFGGSEVTLVAVSSIFSGMADQLAAICSGIAGLFRVPGHTDLPVVLEHRTEWGYPLALLLAGLVALHVRRAPRSIFFWTVLGTLLIYLALVAVGLNPARTPNAGRYVYMGAILTLLLIAELAGDIRWSTVSGLVAVVLLALTLMANVAVLRAAGRLFEAEGGTNRATLSALELQRDRIEDAFYAEDETTTHSHPDMFFPAWEYFDAIDEYGSPAYSLDELASAGEQAREAADQELARALSLTASATVAPRLDRAGAPLRSLGASNGSARPLGPCLRLIPAGGATGTFQLELPPGGFGYRTLPSTEVELGLARFGSAYVNELPATRGSGEVAIPPDASETPWRVELKSAGRTLACPR
jgi:hypothetical protein